MSTLNGVAGRVPWDGCPGTSGSAQVETPARVVRVVVWHAVRALQCLSRALCSSFVPLYSSSGSLLSMASTTVGCAGTPRHGRGHPAMHSMNKHEALHPMNKSLDEVLQTRPCLEALRHAGLCRLLAGAQRNILAHSQAKRTKQFLAAPPPPFTPDFPFSSRSLTFSTERAHFHYHYHIYERERYRERERERERARARASVRERETEYFYHHHIIIRSQRE